MKCSHSLSFRVFSQSKLRIDQHLLANDAVLVIVGRCWVKRKSSQVKFSLNTFRMQKFKPVLNSFICLRSPIWILIGWLKNSREPIDPALAYFMSLLSTSALDILPDLTLLPSLYHSMSSKAAYACRSLWEAIKEAVQSHLECSNLDLPAWGKL